ncbi:hypothetical protein [Roseburia sp. MSJ-14]|uniref:hypothetical protein n=1 Tax=Roseburia sp. MSJ-14 TaxID=2841514 RepID=UPI001C118C35|nr:hypothetical protein [Roseburia sp. MSJ-14]MBU5474566.1 hypothetical protein [Roseburia sp. MSJ-14]
MLDEERICIMTRMASYEAGEGKEDMPVKQYYRKDYISYQMIRSFISSTISFCILLLFWGMYNIENIMKKVAATDLPRFGILILVLYISFIVLYEIITVVVYSRKYTKATEEMKKYHADLKKVMKLQEKEEKLQTLED